jgi:carboxymethylenebutenolidase
MNEQTVLIPMESGEMDAFFVHPATGAHPGIVMWPDIGGLRESKKVMARALAAEGFAVLVPNPYYRGSVAPVFTTLVGSRTAEGKAKVLPLRRDLTADAIREDAKALVGFLDSQGAVNPKRGIGTHGYCMGGAFAVRTAAAVPARVKGAASFHGGELVTAEHGSPHRMLGQTEASFLIAIAVNDDRKNPEHVELLRRAADAADRRAEVEVYPADHGWCVPDSPVWDATQADRAWQRMLALYRTL